MSERPPTTRLVKLTALVLAPVLCGVLAAGLFAGAWLALGSPSPAAGATAIEITRVGAAGATGAPGTPFFALAVGTGARSDDPALSRDDPGLADAIHLIGINPAAGAATILNIPRDTAGPGGAKINSFIVNGGANGLRAEADAVGSIVGVSIPYVIRVNFPNFQAMVDGLGGIDVNIPTAMNDNFSGAHFAAGPAHLNGQQALSFARDRHSFANGDITRTNNQGLLILSALQMIKQRSPSAGDTVHLLATLGRHVKLDGVDLRELFHMGRLALSLDPAAVRNVTIPTGGGPNGNLAPAGAAPGLFADFADDGVLQSH